MHTSPGSSARPASDAKSPTRPPLALVGIGCRFPGGVTGPESLWRLLCDGVDAISPIPRERFDANALYDPRPTPGKLVTRFGGFLEGLDQFDPSFFGISPREAERMDPQQRLLLEVAWEACEDAGLSAAALEGTRTGVYVGSLYSDYEHLQARQPSQFDIHAYTGGARCSLPGRVSHALGLQGPNVSVDTACSSSLVAIHLASQALWSGECTLAIAGGVNVILLPEFSTCFSSAGMLAPDGRCKAFDARGDGFVRSEGCALVVLKPLADAQRDGDRIYAVVRGSAVNHDGRDSPYMMPSPAGQEALLREAYRVAGVPPSSVQFVEAHGTGTRVGDPVEVKALATVLGEGRSPRTPLRLGSVKTNLGHTEGAAGVAGFLKAALALHHRELPRNLHFETPNPNIPWAQLAVQVQTAHEPWIAEAAPRVAATGATLASTSAGAELMPLRAGVNSFGISGINAHVVLEQAPPVVPVAADEADPSDAGPWVLPLSAQTPEALEALARRYLDLLPETLSPEELRTMAYVAARRRHHHEYRAAAVVRTVEEARDQLGAVALGEERAQLSRGRTGSEPVKTVFVFPGQGSQWRGMGRSLIDTQPAFRDELLRCQAAMAPFVEWSLEEVLRSDAEPSPLLELDVVQPALFAVEVALAALWRSWGVHPDVVVGHSMGEAAAAYVAGILTLEDAARIICLRSQAMKKLRGQGAMLATELTLEQAKAKIAGQESRVSVAVSNGRMSTVLSGDVEVLDGIARGLEAAGIFCKPVKVDVASHSPQMDALEAELQELLAPIQPRPGTVAMQSTVIPFLGRRAEDGLKMDASYWWKNLRQPVLFSGAIELLIGQGHRSFLEMSPHPLLTQAITQSLRDKGAEGVAVGSLRRDEDELAALRTSYGALYAHGHPVTWTGQVPRTVPNAARLPSYPFQRERYWIEQVAVPAQVATASAGAPRRGLLGRALSSAADPSTTYWESEVSVEAIAYLGEHRVQGVAVLPGAGFVDLALMAAGETLGAGPHRVSGLTLDQAVFLKPNRSMLLQVQLTTDGRDGRVEIYAREAEADAGGAPQPWTKAASGLVSAAPSAVPLAPDLAQVRARCSRASSAAEHYAAMGARGLQYGPLFQGVQELWRGEGEALARVVLPEQLASDAALRPVHPALLDAVFQTLVAALPDEPAAPPVLPVGVESLVVHQRTREVWVHARLSGTDAGLRGDLVGVDPSGRVVLEVRGLAVRRLSGASEATAAIAPRECLYRGTWVARGRTPSGRAAAPGTWLLFADGGEVARKLAARLTSRGGRCVLVSQARRQSDRWEKLTADHYRLRAGNADATRELVAAVLESGGPPLEGVIHLWTLDAPSLEGMTVNALEGAQVANSVSALHLVQALSARPEASAVRLWMVTRGAHLVEEAGGAVSFTQAPLWGFGRALAQEQPSRFGALIDLDPRGRGTDPIDAVVDELTDGDGENEVAFRNGLRFVGRLARHQPVPARSAFRLRPNATYLITGGFGGLGLEVARWMVRRGARRLILQGRTPLPPRDVWDQLFGEPGPAAQVAAVRELEALGASIHTWYFDVADEEQLTAHLDTFQREGWPPLKGVIHAAGLLQDRTLEQLRAEDFEAVFRPKLSGGWLLHSALREVPLDFFVLFSSAASTLGMPGQANYCAANAFLDALAFHRRSQDLPALSINWGPWSRVGLAASEARGGRLEEMGMGGFTPAQGVEILEQLMLQDAPQVIALPMDWARWAQENPAASSASTLVDLFAEASAPEPSAEPAPGRGASPTGAGAEAPAQDPAERHSQLHAYVLAQVAKSLRQSAERIDARKPINRMGLDSLMAVELKNRIERELGVSVAVVKLLSGASVAELVEEVEAALPPGVVIPGGKSAPAPVALGSRTGAAPASTTAPPSRPVRSTPATPPAASTQPPLPRLPVATAAPTPRPIATPTTQAVAPVPAVAPAPSALPGMPPGRVTAVVAEQLVSRLDRLSHDDVDRLIDRLLDEP